MSRLSILTLLLATLAFSGCSTVDSRIKEKAATFAALDPESQQKLRAHRVEPGYTQDMVYIALGRPSSKKETITAKGSNETWTYLSYYQEYAGQAVTHYRRMAVQDPKTGRVYVYIEPVYASVYREESEERIRVVFTDGKVSSIEEEKDR